MEDPNTYMESTNESGDLKQIDLSDTSLTFSLLTGHIVNQSCDSVAWSQMFRDRNTIIDDIETIKEVIFRITAADDQEKAAEEFRDYVSEIASTIALPPVQHTKSFYETTIITLFNALIVLTNFMNLSYMIAIEECRTTCKEILQNQSAIINSSTDESESDEDEELIDIIDPSEENTNNENIDEVKENE